MLYEDADGASTRPARLGTWRRRRLEAARSVARRSARRAEVVVLGDAAQPADFVSAINAGADAGLRV